MKRLFSKYIIFLLPVFLVLLLTGCGRLKLIDEKLGEMFFNKAGDAENASSTGEFMISDRLDFGTGNYLELTKEQKEKIDAFLEAKGLNRYGDQSGTFYTGGTPLFDEVSGESIDRFEYILKNHPEFFTQ